ncbi:MAG TPA: alpha/beta fold hydrolase [Ktedonobacterales bacterium]
MGRDERMPAMDADTDLGTAARPWLLAALGAAAGLGALAAANRIIAMSAGELYNVLEGDEGRYAWEHGDIAYTVRGRGAPLVLLHGIYAGASSFEYRRVFDALSQTHRVYAPDLLGFGLSARPPVVYTPELYIQLMLDFARQVMGAADNPVSVVASSLAASYAIRAAAEQPRLFERLVLIEPVGIDMDGSIRPTPIAPLMRRLLRTPLIGQGIYNVASSRRSMGYFLRHAVYADRAAVTSGLVDYYYTAAHQDGARYAPASFISGALDTPVAADYAELRQLILLVWGKDSKVAPLDQAKAFRQSNPRAEIRVLDCGALPQVERPDEFVSEVTTWLRAGTRPRANG